MARKKYIRVLHFNYEDRQKKTIMLTIVSQCSSFLIDPRSSLRSREDCSTSPPVSYFLLSFSVMFSDYRKAHTSELLKTNLSIVWTCLVLAP